MEQQLSVFGGAFGYEFRMQVRRPTMWVAMIMVELLMLGIMTRVPQFLDTLNHLKQFQIKQVVVYWTDLLNYILPIAFGVLLADRLQRDKRTKVDEILTATPGSQIARLYGKFIGASLATLLPILLLFIVGLAVIIAKTGNIQVIPIAIGTFASIILPGLFFVGAFSVALPAIIWVPAYQFCLVGYWFWGNLYQPKGIPTLSSTILTPAGGYMSLGFYGISIFPVAHATVTQGIESIILLVVLAILVILGIASLQKFQRSRM